MKEQTIDIALTDIVNAVVKWQLDGTDPSKLHRAEITRAARLLARASGEGYWLEAAEVQPGSDKYDWYPVCWYEWSHEAITRMDERHSFKEGTEAHRVVTEKDVIGTRLPTAKTAA